MKLLQELQVISEAPVYYPTGAKANAKKTAADYAEEDRKLAKGSSFMDLYGQVEDHVAAIKAIIKKGGPLRKAASKVTKDHKQLDLAVGTLGDFLNSIEQYQDDVYQAENKGK